MSITRGTTPDLTFTVSADLTDAEVVYLTFRQLGKTLVELQKDDLTITEDTVEVRLTQEQTLALRAGTSAVEMQFRVRFADGSAIASNIMSFSPANILKEGEI